MLLSFVGSVTTHINEDNEHHGKNEQMSQIAAGVLYVSSPNVPEASGRYEVDDEFPPVRGHLTWAYPAFISNKRTERRIALGSRCSGDVWLIGSTAAVEENMGWLVTLQSHDGRAPDQVPEWGRVHRQDWVPDATIRVTAVAPYVLTTMTVVSPQLTHLAAVCSLRAGLRATRGHIWECNNNNNNNNNEHRWIFLDTHGNWVLGPDYLADTGWAMASATGGRMPHQVTDWRRQDGAGGWVADHTVRVVSPTWSDEDEGCSKFWLENANTPTEGPFSPTSRHFHGRRAYLSQDADTVVYWCPSLYLLAGRPAWVIVSAEETESLGKPPVSKSEAPPSHPHCPGYALCEENTAGDFADAAGACAWHLTDGSDDNKIWRIAPEVRISCYEDLL